MIDGEATRYTLLLSSLPWLPPPLSRQRYIPPSRIQVERALGMLEEADSLRMARINQVLHWSHQPLERDDATVVREAQALLSEEPSPLLREVMLERLEMRTLVAALRRRELGRQPQLGERWAVGRYAGRILANWHDPAFGLGHLFPWLNEAVQRLRSGESLALDRLLMFEAWRRLQRVDDRHDFSFDAVAVYVMRWDILDRLGRQQEEAAHSRFESMLNEALAGHELEFDA